jgi:16S rRNA U1498 N3-methylase RsmE
MKAMQWHQLERRGWHQNAAVFNKKIDRLDDIIREAIKQSSNVSIDITIAKNIMLNDAIVKTDSIFNNEHRNELELLIIWMGDDCRVFKRK